jgi:hypothetical protein
MSEMEKLYGHAELDEHPDHQDRYDSHERGELGAFFTTSNSKMNFHGYAP